ncbi:MAG TPA: M36 family metallopeptidase [Gaiellaceae bacterium]|nr:M36 family metallopeptidase [Gaiellaceae bacterium]
MRRIRVLSRRATVRLVALAGLSVLALTLAASGLAVVHIDGQSTGLPDFDARANAAPTTAQLEAARALHGHVSWGQLGAPASVIHYGGYLATGIRAPSAAAAAGSWLVRHKQLFRLRSLLHLRLETAAPLRGSRVHAVVFRQVFGGVLSADGLVTVTVVQAKHAWRVVYASSTLTPDTAATGKRLLRPVEAWRRAAHAAGARSEAVAALGKTANGAIGISAQGFSGLQTVRPTVFGTPRAGAIRAYDATVTKSTVGAQSSYRVIVDAATGRLLYRQNLVDNAADNPTWLAFTAAPAFNPMNAYPWNYPSTDTRELYCWTATTGCAHVVSDASTVDPMGVASKFPWDVQLDSTGANLNTTQTTGNNVDEVRLWSGTHLIYGDPTLFRDTSATREYQPAFTNAWFRAGCDPTLVSDPVNNPSANDIEAATVNLFVGHNIMHDYAYYLGFDEGHWNSQQYNNGVSTVDGSPPPGGPTATPVGNDGLLGNSQSGAATGSRDNANMATGADGTHARTNMFLWQSLAASFYAPCVDGDYDFSVYGHEFGHMIENRMIGKGVGARQGNAAGAMGEAFGDFDALEVMNALHVAPVPGSDRYTEGAYVTGNPYNGIRDFLAGRPMGGAFAQPGQNPDTDPLNYGDFGFDLTGPEVHADGEIWIAAQIDLRDLFLSRYASSGAAEDIACVRGQLDASQCPGDRRWIQDYYDAMVMMPRNPTMDQARDAMLAADQGRFGGANEDLLWQGFAMRGYGQFDHTVNNADTNPTPDFSSPMADNGTLNFFADAKGTGLPVNAQIYAGDYQARATQIADTDPGTNPDGTPGAVNLDNTAQFAPTGPGSLVAGNARWAYYNFTAVAPGYGIVRFRVKNLEPGETRNITVHFAPNFASATQGATVAGDSLGTNTALANVLDDNEATSDGQTGAPVAGRWFVIHLGGVGPNGSNIKRLGVSALLIPGNNRFTALRSFSAYVCRAGKVAANPTCDGSIDAGWTQLLSAPSDAFPSVNPRPVAPDLSLRYFDAAHPVVGTDVKFVVASNQCTGQPSYSGDQDQDPNVNADCPSSPRASEVHVAEVEVFGQNATVDGTPNATG